MVESKAIDLTDDGGVLKEIKTPGVGDTTPSAGCKVKVHYTGTLLDGTVFDSSKTRGEPFEFDLGKGQVIKAWDRGIATMKKDEVAVFTCKPEYAYGKQGSPPTIPPDSTLVFEVEMISWEAEDISPTHDGGIRREILEEGASFSTPKDGANVEITLKGECEGKVFQEGTFSFVLGEGSEYDIPENLEKALEKFKYKEKSRLFVQPQHLWSGKGNDKLGVPSNKPATYTITMNNFEKIKDTWQLNSDEKLEQGKLLKERGTTYFKQDKFELACRNYKKAIPYLDFDGGFEGEQETERKKTLTACHLNAAMCLLKLKQAKPAKDQCDKAIELEPNNEKAFFRRGNAYLDLNEPELAEKDFQKVLQIDPNNKAAVQKLTQTKQKLREQKIKEKQVYANMFDKFAKHDTEANWRFGWWKGDEVEVEKEDFVETEEDIEEERKLKRKQKEYFMKKAAEMKAKREQLLKEQGVASEDACKLDEDQKQSEGETSDENLQDEKTGAQILENGTQVNDVDKKNIDNNNTDQVAPGTQSEDQDKTMPSNGKTDELEIKKEGKTVDTQTNKLKEKDTKTVHNDSQKKFIEQIKTKDSSKSPAKNKGKSEGNNAAKINNSHTNSNNNQSRGTNNQQTKGAKKTQSKPQDGKQHTKSNPNNKKK